VSGASRRTPIVWGVTDSTPTRSALRHNIHTVIFEADTPAGKLFDVALLLAIVASVLAVCLESVEEYGTEYGYELSLIEWLFTIGFTIEYLLRLYSVDRPLRYARSFYGVVDLLSILPTYLSLVFAGTQTLLVIRALRLLRIFRIFKAAQFISESELLMLALAASRRKIMVFLGVVTTMILILGTLMYLVEGGQGGGFTSIPASIYWAIVTMTTVGYGDIAPKTVLGQSIAAMLMIVGYGIIAVPTGIVSAEFVGNKDDDEAEDHSSTCHSCGTPNHHPDANFCRVCGSALD